MPDKALADGDAVGRSFPMPPAPYFELFNEIGIISQLSSTLFRNRLPDGMQVPHFSVVNHLTRLGDGRTPMQIASAFQVPKATMTHTLSGLLKKNFIREAPNPSDGRSKVIFLTDAGRAFRDRAIASLGPDIVTFARAFPPEGIAELVERLQQIRIYLDNARDEAT